MILLAFLSSRLSRFPFSDDRLTSRREAGNVVVIALELESIVMLLLLLLLLLLWCCDELLAEMTPCLMREEALGLLSLRRPLLSRLPLSCE